MPATFGADIAVLYGVTATVMSFLSFMLVMVMDAFPSELVIFFGVGLSIESTANNDTLFVS